MLPSARWHPIFFAISAPTLGFSVIQRIIPMSSLALASSHRRSISTSERSEMFRPCSRARRSMWLKREINLRLVCFRARFQDSRRKALRHLSPRRKGRRTLSSTEASFPCAISCSRFSEFFPYLIPYFLTAFPSQNRRYALFLNAGRLYHGGKPPKGPLQSYSPCCRLSSFKFELFPILEQPALQYRPLHRPPIYADA